MVRDCGETTTYLLELLDGTLVDATAFVDQVTCDVLYEHVRSNGDESWADNTSGGGFARVDVSDDNDVDMSLVLTG